MNSLTFGIDRDSVCAGDDTDPYQATLTVPATATLQQLITAARRVCPLASIAGGCATWLVDLGQPARCVAVMAQQWDEPRLLVADSTVGEFVANGPCSLHFRYGAQRDPQTVFDALRAGAPPPPRQGTSDQPRRLHVVQIDSSASICGAPCCVPARTLPTNVDASRRSAPDQGDRSVSGNVDQATAPYIRPANRGHPLRKLIEETNRTHRRRPDAVATFARCSDSRPLTLVSAAP